MFDLYNATKRNNHFILTILGLKFNFKIKGQDKNYYIIDILGLKLKVRVKRTKINFFKNYKIKGKNNKIYVVENDVEQLLKPYETIPGMNIQILGDNNIIKIASSEIYESQINICSSNSKISIGRNCWIYGLKVTTMLGNNQEFVWGDLSSICGGEFHLKEHNTKVVVGKDCIFSDQINIWPTDGHAILDCDSDKVLNRPTTITIGDHCWIATGAHFTKNASLASNIIVGAKSVVTKSFDKEYIAIAGNPAKEIKDNIKWVHENASLMLGDIKP